MSAPTQKAEMSGHVCGSIQPLTNFKKLDVLLLDFRGIQFITETNIHTLQCYLMELMQYFYYSQTRQYSECVQTFTLPPPSLKIVCMDKHTF